MQKRGIRQFLGILYFAAPRVPGRFACNLLQLALHDATQNTCCACYKEIGEIEGKLSIHESRFR